MCSEFCPPLVVFRAFRARVTNTNSCQIRHSIRLGHLPVRLALHLSRDQGTMSLANAAFLTSAIVVRLIPGSSILGYIVTSSTINLPNYCQTASNPWTTRHGIWYALQGFQIGCPMLNSVPKTRQMIGSLGKICGSTSLVPIVEPRARYPWPCPDRFLTRNVGVSVRWPYAVIPEGRVSPWLNPSIRG